MSLELPPLSWGPHVGDHVRTRDTLTLTAAAGTDWSNDSLTGSRQHDAALLGFESPAEFTLSARVSVLSARTTFDAAVLAVWIDSDHWAKLCFEHSPQGEAMVVSVVTNTSSDDCNSFVVTDPTVHLRVSRVGAAWAFHASHDGTNWMLVRLFRLHSSGHPRVGFLSQVPMGDTCVAQFDTVRLHPSAPENLRDGS